MKLYQYGVTHQREFLYIMWGEVTTLLNWAVYFICVNFLSIYYLWATGTAWSIAVIFAFIVNKFLVFKSVEMEISSCIRQLVLFLTARGTSGLFELIWMYVMVGFFAFPDGIMKISAIIIVVIVNYVFSKAIVFKG